jgi:thiol-disulfide isomerase/thioredoxin
VDGDEVAGWSWGPPTGAPPPTARPTRRLRRRLLLAGGLAVVAAAVAGWFALAPSSEPPVASPSGSRPSRTRSTAPEAVYTSFEGPQAALSDLRGKPVVLNFWRSDCVPCVTEMPDLERVHRRYGDRVEFLGLATNEVDDEAARIRGRAAGVTYRLGFDEGGAIARRFVVTSIPTTVLIDADGHVVFKGQPGALDASELVELIEQWLRPGRAAVPA